MVGVAVGLGSAIWLPLTQDTPIPGGSSIATAEERGLHSISGDLDIRHSRSRYWLRSSTGAYFFVRVGTSAPCSPLR